MIFSNELTGEQWAQLADLCQNISTNFHLNSDRWIFFDDLLKEIPIEAYPQEDFLRKHTQFVVPEDNWTYYVNILEFQLRGSLSPIDFERDRIRHIILNNRKNRILENLRNEVMAEGQERNWFEIY